MRIAFHFWGTGAKLEKLKKQVGELERKIRQVQEQSAQEVADLQQKLAKLDNPLIIEYVYVDRITVDRLELQNNFGALGIRELGGTLNVGVNCAGGRPPGAGKIPPPEEKREAPGSFPGPSARGKGKTGEGKNPVLDRRQKGPEKMGKEKANSSRGGPDEPKKPAGDRKSGPVWNIGYGS